MTNNLSTATDSTSFAAISDDIAEQIHQELADDTFTPRYRISLGDRVLRSGASRAQFLYDTGIAYILSALIVIAGIAVAGYVFAPDYNYTGARICFATSGGLAAVLSGASAWCIYRAELSLSQPARAFVGYLRRATRQIEQAAKRGQDRAAQVQAAVAQMGPGIDELLLELTELNRASASTDYLTHIASPEYRAALDERTTQVVRELVQVAGEIGAAARILFSERPDLIVALPKVPHALGSDLPATRLTSERQHALADARARLARAVTGS